MAIRYQVRREERPVLVFEAAPGVLLSTAARASGQAPTPHPFVNAQALDPRHEGRLADLLDQASTVEEFIGLLRGDGFAVEPEESR